MCPKVGASSSRRSRPAGEIFAVSTLRLVNAGRGGASSVRPGSGISLRLIVVSRGVRAAPCHGYWKSMDTTGPGRPGKTVSIVWARKKADLPQGVRRGKQPDHSNPSRSSNSLARAPGPRVAVQSVYAAAGAAPLAASQTGSPGPPTAHSRWPRPIRLPDSLQILAANACATPRPAAADMARNISRQSAGTRGASQRGLLDHSTSPWRHPARSFRITVRRRPARPSAGIIATRHRAKAIR